MSTQKLFGIGMLLISLAMYISLTSSPSFAQSGLTIDAVVLRDANLRAGPGTTYDIIGSAKAGQFVTVTDYEGDWYQLSTGEWIARFLVAATPESRVVAFRLEDAPATANRAANLRSGPGTSHAIIGSVQAGQALKIVGQNQTGDWFRLLDGQWVAAFLVNRVSIGLPIVGTIGGQLVSPTAQSGPVPPTSVPVQPTETPAPSGTVKVVIQSIYYDGQVSNVESDEYAVIANGGTASINIGGWRLNAGGPGQDFRFPSFDLAPGQSVRVYTNEYHAESGGFSFGSGNAIWNNQGDCGRLFDASGNQVSEWCY